MRDAILHHAWSCYPAEAIGLVIGHVRGSAQSIRRLKNIGSEGTFFVDPFEQWQAFQEIRRARGRLLAIYHSHPEGGVGLSKSDVLFAQGHDALCMVVALQQQDRQSRFCVYRIRDGVPQTVHVDVAP